MSVSISGTTWKVISVDDEDFNVNENITFHKDGTATLSAHSWIPIKWMSKDNNLVLFFDTDYTKGNFSIKGDAATYLCMGVNRRQYPLHYDTSKAIDNTKRAESKLESSYFLPF